MKACFRTSTAILDAASRGSRKRLAVWQATLAGALLLVLNLGPTGCGCDLEITTGGLPDAVVSTAYAIEFDSHCGGDSWFLSTGTLPPGIALQSNGDFEGVPTLPGTFNFTVGVVDFGSDDQAFKGFTLTVRAAPAEP